jgi:TolB protein
VPKYKPNLAAFVEVGMSLRDGKPSGMKYDSRMTARFGIIFVLAGLFAVAQPSGASSPQPIAQQQQISVDLSNSGKPPRLAIQDFVLAAPDVELTSAARRVADVLWDDIDFEEEFDLVSKEAAARVPTGKSIETIAYDQWAALGAGYVVFAKVDREGTGFSVSLQLVSVTTRQAGFGKKYTPCTTRNPRACAHAISDSIHKDIRRLDGVAQTKLTFTSDRDHQQMAGRPIPNAGSAKEIYIADYDGANQQQITGNQSLNIAPVWGPDGRTIAYTSYVSGFADIYLRNIYDTTPPSRPAGGTEGYNAIQNRLPAWSPDGTKIAFVSARGGGVDIWVVNRDGSGLRQLTFSNKMSVTNSTPTWSPTGTQIAFTSDRTGSNQIYIMSAEGTGVELLTNDTKADRPTWSPAPFNDIAYTSSRPGSGHDVAIVDVATKKVRIMTDGISDNEQPAFAPSGRHIAFVTKRSGKEQIAILDRKGNIQRVVTKDGTNTYPSWSRLPK